MPTLIVEHSGDRAGGPVTGRVLIGRLPTNGIVIHEATVSRMHAWIDRDRSGIYYVGDSGSLAGTQVNGRAVAKRKSLADGDVVRVGHVHILFSLDESVPDDVMPLNLAGSPPSEHLDDAGVLFDCPCGAPVWFKAGAIGQSHVCRHCGRTVIIPAQTGVVAEAVEAPTFIEPGHPPQAAAPDAATVRPSASALFAGVRPSRPAESEPSAEHTDEPAMVTPMTMDSSSQPSEPVATETLDELSELGLMEDEPPAPEHDAGGNGDSYGAFGFQTDEPDAPRVEEPLARPSLFEHGAPRRLSIPPPSAEQPVGSSPTYDDSEIVPIEELAATAGTDAGTHTTQCSICHSAIGGGEAITACPSCGLTFHAGCWTENGGCSAYGCDQVGILQPPHPQPVGESALALPEDEDDAEAGGFPWEFVFMVMSVAGSLLGALAYGVPALIAAMGTGLYLAAFKVPRQRRSVAVIALVVCLLGAAGGVYLSYLWWNGWPWGRPMSRGARP